MRTAVTSRRALCSLGNSVATRVRRLISLLMRSSELVVRSLRRWAAGRLEHGERFRDVRLQPGGQLGRRRGVLRNELSESSVGLGSIAGVQDAAQIAGDLAPHRQRGNVVQGVLSQVELAALPRHAGEPRLAGGFQPGVIVADDVPHAVQAAVLQRGQELAPVDFGLRQRDAHAENGSPSFGRDADGDQHGAGDDRSAVANLLVAGVEDQIRRLAQRAVPPGRQFLVEQGRGAAHLDAADVQPAQFLR